MTPENDKAEDKALEALIAASLRCPDKEPEITEEEINRFVKQKVTLSAEDKAALAASKPELIRSVRRILRGDAASDKDCVHSPDRARGESLSIPTSLSAFAAREGLTTQQTRCLLGMRLEIKAHRNNSKSDDLEAFDWERFYHAVKRYLK